ncbi:MAG: hypothetical protein L0Y72_17875 [Gemmataceae bacterium]|nr:hypothetical protein [Gemmataceae bacterium]MCI0740919.1 hypothetical protein [Gemmataceae bacterium]
MDRNRRQGGAFAAASLGPRQRLTIDQILKWADAHFARTRCWPKYNGGHVKGCHFDLTWRKKDKALRRGFFGLNAGSS